MNFPSCSHIKERGTDLGHGCLWRCGSFKDDSPLVKLSIYCRSSRVFCGPSMCVCVCVRPLRQTDSYSWLLELQVSPARQNVSGVLWCLLAFIIKYRNIIWSQSTLLKWSWFSKWFVYMCVCVCGGGGGGPSDSIPIQIMPKKKAKSSFGVQTKSPALRMWLSTLHTLGRLNSSLLLSFSVLSDCPEDCFHYDEYEYWKSVKPRP